MCVTTNQPDTESNLNPNPTTKQHAIVSIQLNIVRCPTYPGKFIRDNVALFVPTSVVIVTAGMKCLKRQKLAPMITVLGSWTAQHFILLAWSI